MRLLLVPSIHRATHQIALYLQSTLVGEDVSQGEAHVLAHLHEEGPCSVAALQVSFGHKPSTLTSILDRLTRKGLVVRDANAADRRSFVIRPTPRGKILARRVHAALSALEARVLGVKGRRTHLASVDVVLSGVEKAVMKGTEEVT